MRLSILLFAGLRERAGRERLELEDLPDGLDVGALKRVLAERYPEWGSLEQVRGVLEGTYVPDATALSAGQEVALLPPVSGGSPGAEEPALERGVFEISPDPLEPAAVWERVAHPSCGAVCVFTGTTRQRNRDQAVVRLDYEAYGSMASSEMTAIFAGCLERFGPPSAESGRDGVELALRMLVQHRTGRVEVGEPSVIVAVASPHRDAAFLAARFLIDELKARVPLWKKEIYADGHHWIGEHS